MKNKIEIIQFNPELENFMPATGHEEDACLDCYALNDFVLPAFKDIFGFIDWGERSVSVPVKLGFGVKMPKRSIFDKIFGKHWHAEVTGRSSQNKAGVFVMRGIVDEKYDGEIVAFLVNLNAYPVKYEKGDRICQLLFDKCRKPHSKKIRILKKEARKDGGFGSTGR